MSTPFYSPSQQYLREWRAIGRVYGVDTLLGGAYVLAGFFLFHEVGRSQVYNVAMPLIIASIVSAYLTYAIANPQSRGNTLPYYSSLPRDRMTAWYAQLAYVLAVIIGMEVLVLIGTMIKLGGGGITPQYRLHPELFAFPFLSAATILVCRYVRNTLWPFVSAFLVLCVFLTGLYHWLRVGFWEDAEELNIYLPSRGFALSQQYLFATLLLVVTVVGVLWIRKHWQRCEVGEIK